MPELVPTYRRPASHVYIGPIIWQPQVATPDWWNDLPNDDRPIVYIGLGTTGQPRLLAGLLDALADLPIGVIVATAARTMLASPPRNAFVAEYVPGIIAAGRSQLVVCNGGTMSTKQALSVGAPVLGLVSNSDQMVFMGAIVAAGAGERLRDSAADGATVRRVVLRMLSTPSYRAQARWLAAAFQRYDSAAVVSGVVQAAAA